MKFKQLFYKLPYTFMIRFVGSDQSVIIHKGRDDYRQYQDMKVQSITSSKGILIYTLY